MRNPITKKDMENLIQSPFTNPDTVANLNTVKLRGMADYLERINPELLSDEGVEEMKRVMAAIHRLQDEIVALRMMEAMGV